MSEELDPGKYVLRTLGESVTLSCEGERQEQRVLTMGTYLIALRGRCTITGTSWKLRGEILRFARASTERETIRVATMNLSALIPREWERTNYTNFMVNENGATMDGGNFIMNDFQQMHMDDYPEAWIGHHMSWTNSGLIIIICIIIVCMGVWAYKRRRKIEFFFRDARAKLRPPCKVLPVKYERKEDKIVVMDTIQEHDEVNEQ